MTTRPTPTEVIKAWFDNGAPSAFNAEKAGAILAALAKEGYAIVHPDDVDESWTRTELFDL